MAKNIDFAVILLQQKKWHGEGKDRNTLCDLIAVTRGKKRFDHEKCTVMPKQQEIRQYESLQNVKLKTQSDDNCHSGAHLIKRTALYPLHQMIVVQLFFYH
jgi:hypothetical protein